MWGHFLAETRPQVAFWNQRARKLFVTKIPADPFATENWKLHAVWSWERGSYEGLAKGDINGDGREDLVGGGHWFEYLGDMEFRAHRIHDYGSSRSAVGDFDNDGIMEVVLSSGDAIGPLCVYRQRGGRWTKQILIEKVVHGHTLEIADIKGDGYLDIYAAEMHSPGAGDACRQWIFYGDGKGGFRVQLVSVGTCNHESRVGDVDGDGRLDLIGKPYTWNAPRLDIWLNEGPE